LKALGSQAHAAMAETLKTAMEGAGLTQIALARRLKRPQSYVSDMLSGKIAKYGVLEVCDWAVACDMEDIVLLAMFVTRKNRRV
jgi:predicted XRE-type DNA-binding protein